MPIFVYVGNPARKVVRDRETGASRQFKADREEADTITMKTRDGKLAVNFVRDNPLLVEHEGIVARLRANSHFRELPETEKPVAKAELRDATKPEQQPDLFRDEVLEEDGPVRVYEAPKGMTDGTILTDEG